MSATPRLDEMEARARRHLDGMTVNRDEMAKDVLQLVQGVRFMQKRAQSSADGQAQFKGAFDDLFKDLKPSADYPKGEA